MQDVVPRLLLHPWLEFMGFKFQKFYVSRPFLVETSMPVDKSAVELNTIRVEEFNNENSPKFISIDNSELYSITTTFEDGHIMQA